MNFIASPEVVTALALAGRLSFNPLTDSLTGADGKPFTLPPPRPAPEVPPRTSTPGARYMAPPPDGSGVELAIDPASERLQRLAPWPAWDGRDFLDMPVLIKTRGKTTTDHISPRGRGCATADTWSASATTCSWARPTPSPARRGRARTC